MGSPLGFFLTWHTYGTWLHGDEAGSVDVDHNRFGSRRLDGDEGRFSIARRAMKWPPLVLSVTARRIVDAVVRDHCGRRGWDLGALRVRSNHVHVVIGGAPAEPELIMKQLKEWGTRRLRAHGIVGPRQLVWADHGSTVYLFSEEKLSEKIRYVREMQDEVSEDRCRKDWDVKLGLGKGGEE